MNWKIAMALWLAGAVVCWLMDRARGDRLPVPPGHRRLRGRLAKTHLWCANCGTHHKITATADNMHPYREHGQEHWETFAYARCPQSGEELAAWVDVYP